MQIPTRGKSLSPDFLGFMFRNPGYSEEANISASHTRFARETPTYPEPWHVEFSLRIRRECRVRCSHLGTKWKFRVLAQTVDCNSPFSVSLTKWGLIEARPGRHIPLGNSGGDRWCDHRRGAVRRAGGAQRALHGVPGAPLRTRLRGGGLDCAHPRSRC